MLIDNTLIARLRNYMDSISVYSEGRLITFDDNHIAAQFSIDHPGRNPTGCLHVFEKKKTLVAVAELAFTASAGINIVKVQSMIPARYRIKVSKGATENRILTKKKIIIKDRNQIEQRLDDLLGVVVKVTSDIVHKLNNEKIACVKLLMKQGLKPNFFEAILKDDFEVGVQTALMKYDFSDKDYDFLSIFFSTVRSLVIGKAIPYSYEIGSKYDYADAAIRYACEYIIDMERMYSDIEEYTGLTLEDEKIKVLKYPPRNRISLLYYFLKSEYSLADYFPTEDNASDIQKEAFKYLSDPARDYNKRKISSLGSYAVAMEPSGKNHYSSVDSFYKAIQN